MELLVSIVDTFAGSFMAVAQAILIAIGAKYVGVILPLIIVAIYLLQKIYLKTSRQLRLLDLESKSPLYSHFTETLSGLTTIRAFGWQTQSAAKNRRLLDISQKPYYLLYCIQRWLNLVLTSCLLASLRFSSHLQHRCVEARARVPLVLHLSISYSSTPL